MMCPSHISPYGYQTLGQHVVIGSASASVRQSTISLSLVLYQLYQ